MDWMYLLEATANALDELAGEADSMGKVEVNASTVKDWADNLQAVLDELRK